MSKTCVEDLSKEELLKVFNTNNNLYNDVVKNYEAEKKYRIANDLEPVTETLQEYFINGYCEYLLYGEGYYINENYVLYSECRINSL